MAATTSASSSNLGKKPAKWFFMDEEILHLPSRKMGMDAGSELRCRREAAEFIFEMSERLNRNLPHNRGQINHNCMCIAMVHMHRFYVVHPFTVFPPKDVAAACLFMAGKSEECPRKLEHIVEVWFKLKHRKAEQPPFNDTVRKNGADLIVFLEQILLQTIGFDLHVALPHPIVIFNMDKFKLDNKKLTRCAYWFATDIIQLTNWCIRYNERTMACICISIACSWADYEIPETAGTPWYKDIDPEMTEELLNKLVEEFTRVYEEFAACSHARRFIEKAKNANPSTMPAKSIAQLPPPPPPPVLQQQQIVPKKELVVDEQPTQKPPMQRPATADGTLERVRKRSPAQEMPSIDQPGPAAKKFIFSNKSAANSRVATPDIKNSPTVPPPSQPQITGDQLKIPQIKQEVADSSPASISPDKKPNEDGSAAQKKKIGLSEYKQRMKHIKQEAPSDSPASQSTPTSMHGTTPNMSNVKIEDGNGSAGNGNCTATTPSSSMAQTATMDGEQKVKRQSFMPDLSNASSSISVIGAEALTLPVGIPLVEDKKKKERDQQSKSNHPSKNLEQSKEQQRVNKEGSSSRNAGHNIQTSNSATNHRSHSQQHHQQNHKERSHQQQQHGQHREKTDKHQHRSGSNHNHHHREGSSTKIYLNGVSSTGGGTSAQRHHKPEHRGEQRPKIVYQVKEMKQEKQLGMMNFIGKQPPLPPSSPNGNGNAAPPPPPPPPENELEEGELV